MKTLSHFCKVLVGIDQPQTSVSKDELSVMLKYSRDAPTVVEIGCAEGATTLAFATATPSGRVYSIDMFSPGRSGICYGYWIVRTQMSKERIRNIHLVKAKSHEAAGQFDREIDFLFIDGDHSLKGVASDWSDWFPKVKTGGVIALHDCRVSKNSPVELGSMQFYRENLPRVRGIAEIDGVDSLAILKKMSADPGEC